MIDVLVATRRRRHAANRGNADGDIQYMLQYLRLAPVVIGDTAGVPPMLKPLVDAASRGDDLLPHLEEIIKALGFATITYGGGTAATESRPERESRVFVFTTHSREWVLEYDRFSYIEVDPRVQKTWDIPLPMIWDQDSERGASPQTDAFLDAAMKHGIGSGVAYFFHYGIQSHVLFCLNSAQPVMSANERSMIMRNLGEIVLFGTFFHMLFLKGAMEVGATPALQGFPLSLRERECLGYVAKGLHDNETARLMKISPRTIQFHMTNIRSKLNANNRQEAVGIAAKSGLIRV